MKLKLIEANIADKTSNGKNPSDYISKTEIGLYVDSETGIEYFAAYIGATVAMCPRYDTNGLPYRIKN